MYLILTIGDLLLLIFAIFVFIFILFLWALNGFSGEGLFYETIEDKKK